MSAPIERIAIIGFGEVGGIFGNDFAEQGIGVSVYDILFASKRHRSKMMSKAKKCGVRAKESLADCLLHAELVISAVTSSSSQDVGKNAGHLLRDGQVFLDINSVSPESKRKAARYVERSGAWFVEAAVMAAVPGRRLRVPMLLGGAHSIVVAERLASIGLNVTPCSDRIGIASAVKMCRSVFVKGFEALAVECLFAARRYGADDAVLESLAASYPSLGWKDHLPDYLVSRVAQHGVRRASEMREVAQALRAVELRPTMTLAAAERQQGLVSEMAKRNIRFDSTEFSWRALADALVRGRRPRST